MLRNKTAKQHNFATVPRADIPAQQIQNAPNAQTGFRRKRTHTHHVRRSAARRHNGITPNPYSHDSPHRSHHSWTISTSKPPTSSVPNRITWEQYWEQFITGSDDSLVIPTIKPVENGVGFAVLSGRRL